MQIKTINVLWPLGCFRCFVLVIVSVTHFPFPFSILFDSMKSSLELFVHEEFEVSNDYLVTVFKKGLSFS